MQYPMTGGRPGTGVGRVTPVGLVQLDLDRRSPYLEAPLAAPPRRSAPPPAPAEE